MANITFNIINGIPAYHVDLIPDIGVSWSFGSAGVKTIYDIPAGDYAIRITDSNGCVVTVGGIVIQATTTTTTPIGTTTTTTCDPSMCDYGLLYNWYAVDTGKLAPTGWHVPTLSEFNTLNTWLADNGYGYEGSGTDVAKSIASICGWKYSGDAGKIGNDPLSNNSTGFSAYPCGGRQWDGSNFIHITEDYYLWTATNYSSTDACIYFTSYYLSGLINYFYYHKRHGFSVRCVRDTYEGWENDVPFLDYDGNEYTAVELGTQLWLIQNLKVTHYNDGEVISNVTDQSEWAALTTGALCAYDNDWETYACVPEPPTTTTTTTIIYCESPLCETALTVGTDGQGNYGFLRGFIGNIYPDCGSINAIGYFALSGGWIDVVFADNTYCDITLWIDSIEYQLGYVGYHPEYGGYVHGLQVGSNPLPSVGETCDVIICGIECTTTTTSEPITTTTTLEPTTTTTPTP